MERDYSGLALFIRTRISEREMPNSREIKRFVSGIKEYIPKKDIARHDLQYTRNELEFAGLSTSRPSVCANAIINSQAIPLNNAAIAEIQSGNRKKFVMLYDFANGVISPMEVLLSAESYNTDGKNIITNISQAAASLRLDITDEAEAFLALSEIYPAATELLRQDPTGFKLLDYPLQYFAKNRQQFPHEQLVYAGIKHSVDLYKKIYPLTENL